MSGKSQAEKEQAGKTKALEQTLSTLVKRFGEGAIMKMGEATHLQVETIPTGSIALDLALGVGGIPRGRVCGEAPYRPRIRKAAKVATSIGMAFRLVSSMELTPALMA